MLSKYLFICTILSFIIACNGNKSLFHENINTQSACSETGGYWYKNKCWKEFTAEGISIADIDKAVEKQMISIEKANVNINGKKESLIFFFPEMDGKEVTLITIFGTGQQAKTLIQTVKSKQLESKNFSSDALLVEGNLLQMENVESQISTPLASGKIYTTVNNLDNFDLNLNGNLVNAKNGKTYQIAYQIHENVMGAGTSTLEVKGEEIHINGDLGTRTYAQLKEAIANHPKAKTVVLGQISGSVNDAVNMHTGRILREAGLTTKVLKDSEIASGGVDLFCAGKERIVEKGAKLGIHSWCCVDDLTAIDLPKDHPAHQYQIAFFTMCMGEKAGPDFYFHTLEAAPFDDVHWMSDEAIKKWGVSTKFIE